MRLYILYEIIVLGVYIIYKLGQHPGGDAGRLRARQLDLEEAIAPSFRSSLGGGILILLHIMGGIAIVICGECLLSGAFVYLGRNAVVTARVHASDM